MNNKNCCINSSIKCNYTTGQPCNYYNRIKRKKNKFKDVLSIIYGILLFGLVGWYGSTTIIYSIYKPELTSTEVFLHTPKHLMLNFK